MEASNPPLLVGTLAFVAGLAIGVVVTLLLSRRSSGGKSLDALREEFDDYREGVNDHFEKTSELFRDMTEKYRDVYNHLATGAQTFGQDLEAVPRLEMVGHGTPDEREPEAAGDEHAAAAEEKATRSAPDAEGQADVADDPPADAVAETAVETAAEGEPVDAGERVGGDEAILVESDTAERAAR